MTAEEPRPPSPGNSAPKAREDRLAREKERLAQALRDNLRRRKDQARLRRRGPEAE